MHCPQCGVEPVHGETRFCRACGFALEEVKELLLPDPKGEKALDRRKRSAFNQGLAVMLFTLVLVIVMTLLGDLNLVPEIVTKLVAALFLLVGLARMFYPYVVQPTPVGKVSSRATNTETTKLPGSLPPKTTEVARVDQYPVDTAQLTEVGSVTEHTTRKLKEAGDGD